MEKSVLLTQLIINYILGRTLKNYWIIKWKTLSMKCLNFTVGMTPCIFITILTIKIKKLEKSSYQLSRLSKNRYQQEVFMKMEQISG